MKNFSSIQFYVNFLVVIDCVDVENLPWLSSFLIENLVMIIFFYCYCKQATIAW